MVDPQRGSRRGAPETNSTLLPGRTIFHLTLPLPDGLKLGLQEIEKEGFIQIGLNDPLPELIISTSDGESCSLAACGSVG